MSQTSSVTPVPPTREHAAYRYRNAALEIVWDTSVPLTDDEALEYFKKVASWSPPNDPALYVEYRPFGEFIFVAMPYKWNPETREAEIVGV